MFRSLLCVSKASLALYISLLFCSLSLTPVSVLVSAQQSTNVLEPVVDRQSATTARVRFLNVAQSLISYTLIQYTNSSSHFNLNRIQFHACATFASTGCPANVDLFSEGGREINITQGTRPITSYILRDLNPSTKYYVRMAYIDKQNQIQGSAPAFDFTTRALDPSTTLNSLVASGGCGSLTSTGALYWLKSSTEGGGAVQIYTCRVVSETSTVTLSVIPETAYATITPSTDFSTTNQTLSVNAQQVDPLTIYTHNITLGAQGTTTNFSFQVNAQSGATKTYTLSIIRALPSSTSDLVGPSANVTALIRSPSVPTSYMYRALLWSGASVNQDSWKVWSDDLTVFPFSAFNITFNSTTGGGAIDYTLATVSVTPAISNPIPGTCSNIYVGLFDNSEKSNSMKTCVAALNDYCSATPFGAATKWQTFLKPNGQFDVNLAYHPAPPTPTFPKA